MERGSTTSRLRGTRIALIVIELGLTVLGILFIHSTLSGGADFRTSSSRGQVIKATVGVVAFLCVARLDYRVWERYAYAVYLGLALVLVVMVIVKFASGGLLRFIRLDKVQVQPSELMKIALVVALARYLRFRQDQRQLRGLIAPFLITVIPMGLVLLQPDLGTSLMFPPVLLGMLFIAGAKWRYLSVAILIGLLLLPTAYFAHDRGFPLMKGYQYDRIVAFIKRDAETLRTFGYQPLQSEIAVASGGLVGKGYEQGTQNRLGYVPESHTDFIFSIIAEETGFLGASTTVVMSFLLAFLMLRVAMLTREPFGRLVATGFALEFAAQSFQNIAMAMRLSPVTGLTLPFVSFGGSSLVVSFVAVGIVYSIAARRVQVMASEDLNPRDAPRRIPIMDDRAAGSLQHRWPTE